jgi:hypothetical protein
MSGTLGSMPEYFFLKSASCCCSTWVLACISEILASEILQPSTHQACVRVDGVAIYHINIARLCRCSPDKDRLAHVAAMVPSPPTSSCRLILLNPLRDWVSLWHPTTQTKAISPYSQRPKCFFSTADCRSHHDGNSSDFAPWTTFKGSQVV